MTDLRINIKSLLFRKYSYSIFIMFLMMIIGLTSCLKSDDFTAAGTPNSIISILDVRKIYKGEDVVLTKSNMTGAEKITGVVVSDAASGNIPSGVFAIQQTSRTAKRGIEVFVQQAANIPYNVGDSVVVFVEGSTITKSRGALQIHIPSLSNISKVAENVTVEPTQLTLRELNNKFTEYESTLIKVSNVDAAPESVLDGNAVISESGGAEAILHTEPSAIFKGRELALNATYTAVARWNEDVKQLWLLNEQSIEAESGSIYPIFPETFETGDAALYASGYGTAKTGSFSSGNYTLTNTVMGKEANDRAVSGEFSVRMNGGSTSNSWVTMNYDLANGATKVTLWAGSYGASADFGSTWRLEYSQNQGITWSQVGDDILTVSKNKQQYVFLMDIKGAVRFRFGKIGIGASTTNNQNGRFSLDDFAVYSNEEGGGPIPNPVPTYQKLLGWQFGDPLRNGDEATINSSYTITGLNTAVLSRGNGLIAASLPRAFSSTDAGTTRTSSKALALSKDVFYQVQFVVQAGNKLSLSAINTKIRRSAAGATNHRWYYSLDGANFKETIGTGDINFENSGGDGTDMPPYYLYQTPELQNIPAGTTVTLRMYAWGFTTTSGSFAIGRTPTDELTKEVLTIGGVLEPQ